MDEADDTGKARCRQRHCNCNCCNPRENIHCGNHGNNCHVDCGN